jgi:hypothetical protein
MTTRIAPAPMPDSEVNAWLEPLKAVGYDEAGIDAALTGLLTNPAGRASLVQHLADMAVLATEPSLTDVQRGRLVRAHFDLDPVAGASDVAPERAADGSIVRHGVSGWTR